MNLNRFVVRISILEVKYIETQANKVLTADKMHRCQGSPRRVISGIQFKQCCKKMLLPVFLFKSCKYAGGQIISYIHSKFVFFCWFECICIYYTTPGQTKNATGPKFGTDTLRRGTSINYFSKKWTERSLVPHTTVIFVHLMKIWQQILYKKFYSYQFRKINPVEYDYNAHFISVHVIMKFKY